MAAVQELTNDARVQRDVLDELQFDPEIKATDIGVEVHDGVVTLVGKVHTYHEKWIAERDVLRMYGVRGVANEIEVQLVPEHERSDTDIARAAARALEWNVAIPQGQVKVGVSGGRVVLEGTVGRQYQRAVAESAIRRLVGVRALSNLIQVERQEKIAVPIDKVHERIERALTRSALLDARRIAVTVNDSTVALEGNVRSWAEREEVARAAWATPGVRDVLDNLHVVP